ncbi:hypothetical protein MY11210_007530 [Beauveria gryllotalpidicola]
MEWRGVTYPQRLRRKNFFFVAAVGLLISAQWELSVGNGFAYTVFSAFGLLYAGYGAISTPSFGVRHAYGDDVAQYNNGTGLLSSLVGSFYFYPFSSPRFLQTSSAS